MTFLKWVGGKTQLLPSIADLLPDMKKIKGYAEPFIGGGSVFFYLKRHGYLENKPVYLSDVNNYLIDTYKVVRNNWKEVLPLLEKMEKEHCESYYYNIRDNFPLEGLSTIEKASQFIYLNKACFNGQMRFNSDGKYNMGIGRNEKVLEGQKEKVNIFDLNELYDCSKILQGINIGVMSFEHVIRIPNIERYYVFMDPPYDDIGQNNFVGYTSDRFVDKRNYLFSTFKKLDELGCKVMLSNSYNKKILDEFKEYSINIVKAKRMVNCKGDERGEIDEVIITNYKPPKIQQTLGDF